MEMYSEVIRKAGILWNYMSSFNRPGESDTVIVCCSYDLRVCDYACRLIQEDPDRQLVFTGGRGNWTSQLWRLPEAHVYRERAIENGISPSRITTEEEATNLGENIRFTRERFGSLKSAIFVSKPNTLLRLRLTARKQWPGITAFTAGPALLYPGEVSNITGVYGVINEMVGDIQRILVYPSMGFQEPHIFPGEVLEAWEYLRDAGFTDHCMKDVPEGILPAAAPSR